MIYAIAIICVSLVVLALLGKPIRIEIIHTVTAPPVVPEIPVPTCPDTKNKDNPLDALMYMNKVFYNMDGGTTDATEDK